MGFFDSIRGHFNNLPLIGSSFEGVWGDPKKEKHMRSMENVGQQMQANRPINIQTQMNAAQNAALAFNPMQKQMAAMYGMDAVPEIGTMVRNNPFPANHPAFAQQQTQQNGLPPAWSGPTPNSPNAPGNPYLVDPSKRS